MRQVAELTRDRVVLATDKYQEETTYLITNMPETSADAAQLLQYKRDHWQIENGLHYIKDFVFGEDRSTIRKGSGPRVMAALRNFALGTLRLMGVKNIKRWVDTARLNAARLVEAVCY